MSVRNFEEVTKFWDHNFIERLQDDLAQAIEVYNRATTDEKKGILKNCIRTILFAERKRQLEKMNNLMRDLRIWANANQSALNEFEILLKGTYKDE